MVARYSKTDKTLKILLIIDGDRDGNLIFYMMNPDGSELKRITYNPARDLSPCWSPLEKDSLFTAIVMEIGIFTS